jgi:hypothetical protein
MRHFFHYLLAAMLGAWLSPALADTLYKCVQADGKVAFSSLPCQGQARQAGQLDVPAPEADAVSAARLARERDKLRAAEQRFRKRNPTGNVDSSAPASRIANVPTQRTPAAKAAAEQAEAARLNAARIGNCGTPRPAANCL